MAARYRHYDVVKQLLDAKCQMNMANKDGWTALHLASHYGYPEVVQLLLKANCGVNITNKAGRTALHLAALAKNDLIAENLLRHGARVDICDEDGDTPLHKAALKKQKLIVIYLVEAGADVRIMNKAGKTPLSIPRDYYVTGHLRNMYLRSQANELEVLWVDAQRSSIAKDRLLSCLHSRNIKSFACFVIAHNLLLLSLRQRVFDVRQTQAIGGSKNYILQRVYLPITSFELSHGEKHFFRMAVTEAEMIGLIDPENEAQKAISAYTGITWQYSEEELQMAIITLARDIYELRYPWEHHSSEIEEFKELCCNDEQMYNDMQDLHISLQTMYSALKGRNDRDIIKTVISFCLTIIPVVGGRPLAPDSAESKTTLGRPIVHKGSVQPSSDPYLSIVDFSNIWTAAMVTSNVFVMKLDSYCWERLECVVKHSEFKTIALLHSQITSAITKLDFIKLELHDNKKKVEMQKRFRTLASSADMNTISAHIAIEELHAFLENRFSWETSASNPVTQEVVTRIDKHGRLSLDAFLAAFAELARRSEAEEPKYKAKRELVNRFRIAASPDKKLLIVIAKALLIRMFEEFGKSMRSTGTFWNESTARAALHRNGLDDTFIDEKGFMQASLEILFRS
eukprot:TRINITY_DN54_c0_g2_i2.p1 TRINITY_DN54_c0_g2~~TRINITY_DN54_c0_g2_i2.p1  ORF type:complete len:626 (-),score=85.51 TRINITY_DN54_c0_g2_i2:1852-3729(-)